MDIKKKGNFVQKLIFINLYLITSETNGEWEELSMPILLLVIDNLVCLGSFNPFFRAYFLACQVREEIFPWPIAKDEEQYLHCSFTFFVTSSTTRSKCSYTLDCFRFEIVFIAVVKGAPASVLPPLLGWISSFWGTSSWWSSEITPFGLSLGLSALLPYLNSRIIWQGMRKDDVISNLRV